MIHIGSLNIATEIFFAPLSGCSDLSFRLIARECGAKFCFFEMVNAHSLLNPNPKRFNILRSSEADRPIAAQLVGEDPEMMLDAAQMLLEHDPAVQFLDINSACPVKKVVKKGAGAALIKDPQRLERMIDLLASRLSVPVTIKLRLGYHQTHIPTLTDLVKRCEASGVAAVFLHGRTRDQGYSGDVDYAAIRAAKESLTIPLIGSGNIFTPELAQQMFDSTACDGVLVARGAFGNPWLFRQIEHYRAYGETPPPVSFAERKAVVKRHLAYLREYRNSSPLGKIGFMRKMALWYLKAFPGASKIRGQINTIADYDSLLAFIDEQMPDSGSPLHT